MTVIYLRLLRIVDTIHGFWWYFFFLPELFSFHDPRDNSSKTVTELSKRDGTDAL